MGWHHLVKDYKFEGIFSGKKVGLINANINGVDYNNAIVLKYNDKGFYLKGFFIFSLFHTPLFIPWTAINHANVQKKILFGIY